MEKVNLIMGTDFAAPVGTPIRATADGTVIKSGYTRGNGYYVTVSHNSTYSTQYLHMNKRGLKVGTKVKQGDKIGEWDDRLYIRSTRLLQILEKW